jgi:hypothetical protein
VYPATRSGASFWRFYSIPLELPCALEHILCGAFSWARIQRLYDADAVIHWQRCESEGLQCLRKVFTQLYELLVGYTRLRNLLGLLERQEVSEVQKHLIWVG